MEFYAALRDRSSPLVMGVLNATPDSFSDGGEHLDPDAAVTAGRRMIEQGAAILDIGGESTRPGAAPVAATNEWDRVAPILERLKGLEPLGGTPLSIDTRNASTARLALDAGAVLVNDVSAGSDPDMLPTVAAAQAGICLMHMRGEPCSMQDDPCYEDVVTEVEDYLLERAGAAEAAGIARERIVIDPGIGFGKTLEHNLALLRATTRLASHGYALLLGVSRKRFLGDLTGRAVEERTAATIAAVSLGAYFGAAIIRVHEVASAIDAVRVAHAWRSSR